MKANEWHYENEGGEIRIFRRGMRLGRQPPIYLLNGMLRLGHSLMVAINFRVLRAILSDTSHWMWLVSSVAFLVT